MPINIVFVTSYFSERSQLVKIGDFKNNLLIIPSGVSKNLFLGPFLFNIYVNEIGKLNLVSRAFQYADDTALVLAGSDESEALLSLQADIYKLMAWFKNNSIYVNIDKTKLM